MPARHALQFPLLRRFISFTIDPVTAVASIDDPEVHDRARHMNPKRYLACVTELKTLDFSQEWLKFRFALVTRGPISADATKGVEDTMCTPIYPATHHPCGREPIRPTYVSWNGRSRPTDLPYDNCYFHSSDATFATVRVKRTYRHDWRRHITLEAKEAHRRRRLVGEDCEREDELLEEIKLREEAERSQQQGHQGAATGDGSGESPCADDDLEDTNVPDGVEGGDIPNDTLAEVHGLFNLVLAGGLAGDDVIPVMNVTYDVWKYPDFADAKEFHEESAQIRRMIAEAKAKAIARAQRLDQEAYGDKCPSSHTAKGEDQQEVRDSTVRGSTPSTEKANGTATRAGWKLVSGVVSNLVCRLKP